MVKDQQGSPQEKGQQLTLTGTVVCGSSVAVFLPALLMLSRRGTSSTIVFVILACWFADFAFGLWFIVRGRKLMQQGSENNG